LIFSSETVRLFRLPTHTRAFLSKKMPEQFLDQGHCYDVNFCDFAEQSLEARTYLLKTEESYARPFAWAGLDSGGLFEQKKSGQRTAAWKAEKGAGKAT
jgi:hypothetical protein